MTEYIPDDDGEPTLSVSVECDADSAMEDIRALRRAVQDLNAELEYLNTLLSSLGSDDSDDDVEAGVSRGLQRALNNRNIRY